MVRFKYNKQLQPSAPLTLVRVIRPDGVEFPEVVPAQLDTGADRTVIPAKVASALELHSLRLIPVETLGGAVTRIATCWVSLRIHNLTPVKVEAIRAEGEEIILLGRDFLNHFCITLDGPSEVLTIEAATA
jgi:aspartyl protease family protein